MKTLSSNSNKTKHTEIRYAWLKYHAQREGHIQPFHKALSDNVAGESSNSLQIEPRRTLELFRRPL